MEKEFFVVVVGYDRGPTRYGKFTKDEAMKFADSVPPYCETYVSNVDMKSVNGVSIKDIDQD